MYTRHWLDSTKRVQVPTAALTITFSFAFALHFDGGLSLATVSHHLFLITRYPSICPSLRLTAFITAFNQPRSWFIHLPSFHNIQPTQTLGCSGPSRLVLETTSQHIDLFTTKGICDSPKSRVPLEDVVNPSREVFQDGSTSI